MKGQHFVSLNTQRSFLQDCSLTIISNFLEELKHETATFYRILVIGSFGSNSVECIGIKGVFNYFVFDPVKLTVGEGGYFYNGCPNQIITVCSSMAVW